MHSRCDYWPLIDLIRFHPPILQSSWGCWVSYWAYTAQHTLILSTLTVWNLILYGHTGILAVPHQFYFLFLSPSGEVVKVLNWCFRPQIGWELKYLTRQGSFGKWFVWWRRWCISSLWSGPQFGNTLALTWKPRCGMNLSSLGWCTNYHHWWTKVACSFLHY